MALRRLQKNGHLYKRSAWWRLRWREDVIGEDGQIKRLRPVAVIGRCEGPDVLTERKLRGSHGTPFFQKSTRMMLFAIDDEVGGFHRAAVHAGSHLDVEAWRPYSFRGQPEARSGRIGE